MVYYAMPVRTLIALSRYKNQHIPTGGFLRAVLENDLCESFRRADDGNLAAMHEIVKFCYNELDIRCWGSPEKVEEWLQQTAPAVEVPHDRI